MDKESILIFGTGPLQKSLIERCKLKGLFTVGIDPMEDALCKNDVDAFEVVGGQDFERTKAIAANYQVKAIITAATDKPLIMMARIAEQLKLPFFSIETAEWSTDKLLMKQKFLVAEIPCAKGFLLNNESELESIKIDYPVIVKPRDNSGSRGVKLCKDIFELKDSILEALQNSQMDNVLIEEFIEGKEYSIESIHFGGQSEIVQFTEKTTTSFPYNVELAHTQPANLSEQQKTEILNIIKNIGRSLKFENCASHTELKINGNGIFVIETSPRLGGDYITSTLVPLSTGINMEDLLISISLGRPINSINNKVEKASGVCFFTFKEGLLSKIDSEFENVKDWPGILNCELKLKENNKVPLLTSSLSRYGQFIVSAGNRIELDEKIKDYCTKINRFFQIKDI